MTGFRQILVFKQEIRTGLPHSKTQFNLHKLYFQVNLLSEHPKTL